MGRYGRPCRQHRHRKMLQDPARSKTLCMHGNILHGNREIPCLPKQRSHWEVQGRKPVMNEQWEVGQLHSTEEIAEQRLERVSGGDGGKGVGQGEPVGAKHAPDSEPDKRATCARTGTSGGSGPPWRHYLRQEPGAVVPHAGICAGGGCGETRIPTATKTKLDPPWKVQMVRAPFKAF